LKSPRAAARPIPPWRHVASDLAESPVAGQNCRMLLLRRLHFGPVLALRDAQG